MENRPFCIKHGTLIRKSPNGNIQWRRPLGAFVLGSNKALKNATLRRSGDVLRVVCNGVEVRVDMKTGQVRQVVRSTHFGRKSRQQKEWTLDDMFDQLDQT